VPPPESRGPSTTLVGIVLLVVSGIAVFAAGLSLGSQGAGRDAGERAAVEAFAETYRGITRDYVGEWDAEELLQGAIEGMLSTLDDPYTDYLGPDEFEPTLADISGEFEGIGARMGLEEAGGAPCELIGASCRLRVVEVLEGSPALGAGLLADDVVVAVDGQPLAGRSIDDAVAQVRGPRGSEVTLTLERGGQQLTLPITRGLVISRDVRAASLADGAVGYLRVDAFSERAGADFEAALREHLEAGVTGLVIDLRDDPGGFVDAAVAIADQFLPGGPVYWEEDAAGRQVSVDASGQGSADELDIPIAVLVDGRSASASEIVAGALQDAGRAALVGAPTFGKGTVQEWSQLPGENGGLRLSVAKWLTRDKHWIDGRGLQPDVRVSEIGERFWPRIDGEDADADVVDADPQLRAALDWLLTELQVTAAEAGTAAASPMQAPLPTPSGPDSVAPAD
jgi:carboxyl-terminal processing protease